MTSLILFGSSVARYRAQKFVQRHTAGVTAAVLIFLTLVGGIIASSWQARIAREQRERAERRFNDVRKLAKSLNVDPDDFRRMGLITQDKDLFVLQSPLAVDLRALSRRLQIQVAVG